MFFFQKTTKNKGSRGKENLEPKSSNRHDTQPLGSPDRITPDMPVDWNQRYFFQNSQCRNVKINLSL